MWRLVERYREGKKDSHIVFIDLEKANEKVSRVVVGRCLDAKDVLMVYIRDIKDMYDGTKTQIKEVGET